MFLGLRKAEVVVRPMPQKKSLASMAETFFLHHSLSDSSFDFHPVQTGFSASHGRYPFTLVAKSANRAGLRNLTLILMETGFGNK